MRSRVVGCPGKPKTKGVGGALRYCLVQLLDEICDQCGLRWLQIRWISGQRERAVQLEVCETAHVIEVQSVGCIIRTRDVCICPVRCLPQVIGRRVQVNRAAVSTSLNGEIKLGCSEFHVVTPFCLRVKAEGNGSEEIPNGCGVCQ